MWNIFRSARFRQVPHPSQSCHPRLHQEDQDHQLLQQGLCQGAFKTILILNYLQIFVTHSHSESQGQVSEATRLPDQESSSKSSSSLKAAKATNSSKREKCIKVSSDKSLKCMFIINIFSLRNNQEFLPTRFSFRTLDSCLWSSSRPVSAQWPFCLSS